MSAKDRLLALCVVVVWGVNFVVMKIGLQDMPPFLLAGLRFLLVALPMALVVPMPRLPLRWLVAYGMTISFGQFAFLFCAIKLGMPAGIASLVLQSQAFFTLLAGALLLGEKLRWHHLLGFGVAAVGMAVLAEGGTATAGMAPATLLLTLAAALSWACGNICNKQIMSRYQVSAMSLVVWSALIPVGPFLLCSWLFDGPAVIADKLRHFQLSTLLALLYLSFVATIVGYAIWSKLLSRYETWRVAPLSLLVPVVGLLSAALLLGEGLSLAQLLGAAMVMAGLLVNLFGPRLLAWRPVRREQ